MSGLGVKELAAASIITVLNAVLSALLGQPYELPMLVVTVNLSVILVLLLGLLAGILGDLLVALAELSTITVVYIMRLGAALSPPNALYIAAAFLTGLAISTSFFRGIRLARLNIMVGAGAMSDFLMLCGLSLILAYVLGLEPSLRLLLASDLSRPGAYVLAAGLAVNSLLLSTCPMVRARGAAPGVAKYVALGIIGSLSWTSLPLVIALNQLRSDAHQDYFVLGRVVRRLGGRLGVNVFKGFIKVPLTPSLNKHLVIVGMSGAGKSYLAKSVARQLAGRVPVLIIDPHGEYVPLASELGGRVLTPYDSPLNPLETFGKPKNIRAEEVSDVIRRVFRLGSIQKYVLYSLILDTYARLGDSTPTFNDVYETLINYLGVGLKAREGYFSREALNSLIPYLELLRGPYLTSSALRTDELFATISVVNLGVVDSEFLRGVYVETLLQLIDSYIRSASRQLFVVIDEAHRFLGGRVAPLLSRLVTEGRKFGLSVVVITQQPLDLDPAVIANSAFIVSFAIQEADNLNYVARVMSGGGVGYDTVRRVIASLGRYEALVKIRGDNSLYVIKTLKA